MDNFRKIGWVCQRSRTFHMSPPSTCLYRPPSATLWIYPLGILIKPPGPCTTVCGPLQPSTIRAALYDPVLPSAIHCRPLQHSMNHHKPLQHSFLLPDTLQSSGNPVQILQICTTKPPTPGMTLYSLHGRPQPLPPYGTVCTRLCGCAMLLHGGRPTGVVHAQE